MTQPQELIFRCPECGKEVQILVTEFDQVPVCEEHRRMMIPVGGTGDEVNRGVHEIMTGMTRLAAAALTKNPGTGPLGKASNPPPEQN